MGTQSLRTHIHSEREPLSARWTDRNRTESGPRIFGQITSFIASIKRSLDAKPTKPKHPNSEPIHFDLQPISVRIHSLFGRKPISVQFEQSQIERGKECRSNSVQTQKAKT